MHPVQAVPTRYNPFVSGEKTNKPITQWNPLKPKKPAGLGFFLKIQGFLNSGRSPHNL